MKSYLEIVFSIDFTIKHLPVRTGSKVGLRKMNSGSKVGPTQMKNGSKVDFNEISYSVNSVLKTTQMDKKWVDICEYLF